jgi:general secretion pathway protein A
MYERFYGLHEPPFALTPNQRFFLLTPSHLEALSNIEYGVASRCGITLLIGEAGTGKTTILRRALAARMESREVRVLSVYLNNPMLTRSEFLEFMATQFHLSSAAAGSKTRLLSEIEQLLRNRRRRGETTVLMIDEAQSLPADLLEEIRLLANIETDTEKLLPLVLAAQPEMAARLNSPALRQLKQRVALRCRLAPLTLTQTAGYIAGRIRLAGGDPVTLFSHDAVRAIHEHARGIPRTISVICDNALLSGFATKQRPVGSDLVDEVCRDFDLHGSIDGAAAAGLRGEPGGTLVPGRTFSPAAVEGWSGAADHASPRVLERR